MDAYMIQQVMPAPGEIVFRKIPVPTPGPNEVLIKIHTIGICGSDIHVYHGKHPFTSYPVTQGHEVSGEVSALGEQVSDLYIGQKVTIEPQVFCGKCYPCTHGKYNLCENLKVMGFQTTGTASTYFIAHHSKITPLPEMLTYEEGAMIEPLSVAVHAVRRFGDVTGKQIAVLGAGPIGNLVAQAAKAMGAKSVLITDISDYRLALARQCGADFAVNTTIVPFGKAIVDAFGPDKADVIYDCAGTDMTMDQAIQNARKGSSIILVAVFSGIAKVDLAVLNDHELDLNTTMMYRHEDYATAIDLVNQRIIKLQPLMSKRFPFGKYLDAYRYIDKNREASMKILIDVLDQKDIVL